MISFALFTLSGAAIALLILSKRFEEKRRKTIFILKAVARGDERFRELHHRALHFYTKGKERTEFMLKKQLPLRARSLFDKLQVAVREAEEKYVGDIRNSKLLKRSDGLSDFFKNISEIEKGNGEINEVYMQEEEIEKETVGAPVMEVTEIVEDKPVKLLRKKPAKARVPRQKRVKVLEVVEME